MEITDEPSECWLDMIEHVVPQQGAKVKLDPSSTQAFVQKILKAMADLKEPLHKRPKLEYFVKQEVTKGKSKQ